jgi:hypothetical protein
MTSRIKPFIAQVRMFAAEHSADAGPAGSFSLSSIYYRPPCPKSFGRRWTGRGLVFELLPQAIAGIFVKRRKPLDYAVTLSNEKNMLDPRCGIAEARNGFFQNRTVPKVCHIHNYSMTGPHDQPVELEKPRPVDQQHIEIGKTPCCGPTTKTPLGMGWRLRGGRETHVRVELLKWPAPSGCRERPLRRSACDISQFMERRRGRSLQPIFPLPAHIFRLYRHYTIEQANHEQPLWIAV